MNIVKTNEKILIWMHRSRITQQEIAKEIGIPRQAWAQKMKDNIFDMRDMMVLKRMGFGK